MRGYVTVTTLEDGTEVQKIEGHNKIMETAVNNWLSDVFYSNYNNYDANVQTIWSFEQLSTNSRIADFSGNSKYLSRAAGSTLTFVDGPCGKAGHFDGTSRYACSAVQSNRGNDSTLEFWFRSSSFSSLVTPWSFSPYSNTFYACAWFQVVSSVMFFYSYYNSAQVGNYYSVKSYFTLSTDTWYHVAGVHSTTYGMLLFINGVLAGYDPTMTTVHSPTPTSGDIVGCRWISGPNYDGYLTGDIDNMIYTKSTKYKGTIIGQKYFEPQKTTQTVCKCSQTSANYRLNFLILSNDSTQPNRYTGTKVDDYTYNGSYLRTDGDLIIDLNNLDDNYDVTVSMLSVSSVKLTVTIPTDVGMGGPWNSLILAERCMWNRTDLTYAVSPGHNENTTFPIISKIVLPSPIIKYRKQTLVIEWTLTLTA